MLICKLSHQKADKSVKQYFVVIRKPLKNSVLLLKAKNHCLRFPTFFYFISKIAYVVKNVFFENLTVLTVFSGFYRFFSGFQCLHNEKNPAADEKFGKNFRPIFRFRPRKKFGDNVCM